MVRRCVVVRDEEAVVEERALALGPDAARVERADVGEPLVESFGDSVDLGAHAGRQDDRLGDVRAVAQLREGLRQVTLGDGDPREHIECRVALVETDDYDWHRELSSTVRVPPRLVIGGASPPGAPTARRAVGARARLPASVTRSA